MVESTVVRVMICSVGSGMVGNGGVEDGGIGLGLPLAQSVSEDGASTNSQSSAVAVLLLEESWGREEAGDIVDSSLQVSIVSSLGLVPSDRDGDGEIGGSDLSLHPC